MIRTYKDLSPDQKAAIESILGRQVLEDEEIAVTAIQPPTLSDQQRGDVLQGLAAHFARVDERRRSVSPEDADAIIDEALRSTRPNYRPAR